MLGKSFTDRHFSILWVVNITGRNRSVSPTGSQQASSTTPSFPRCLAHVSPLLMCFVFEYVCPPAICRLQEVQSLPLYQLLFLDEGNRSNLIFAVVVYDIISSSFLGWGTDIAVTVINVLSRTQTAELIYLKYIWLVLDLYKTLRLFLLCLKLYR